MWNSDKDSECSNSVDSLRNNLNNSQANVHESEYRAKSATEKANDIRIDLKRRLSKALAGRLIIKCYSRVGYMHVQGNHVYEPEHDVNPFYVSPTFLLDVYESFASKNGFQFNYKYHSGNMHSVMFPEEYSYYTVEFLWGKAKKSG